MRGDSTQTGPLTNPQFIRVTWFWILSAVVMALYLAALVVFAGGSRTWAAWALVVIVPGAWAIKGIALVFNRSGREKVASLAGDKAWGPVALAWLPIALLLAVLAILVRSITLVMSFITVM